MILQHSDVSENGTAVRMQVKNFNKRQFLFCQTLDSFLKNKGIGELEIANQMGITLSFSDEYDNLNDGLDCSVKVTKSSTNIFLTEKGAISMLSGSRDLPDHFYFYFLDSEFHSETCTFLSRAADLNLFQTNSVIKSKAVQAGLKFTKALSQEAIAFVPGNVNDWILEESSLSFIPKNLKDIFSKKLFSSLSTESIVSETEIDLYFRGERTIKISRKIDNMESWIDYFESLQSISKWVFSGTTDPDTRHTLFNSQLASIDEAQLNEDATLINSFSRILSNTILSYRYHLIKSTKDLNKLLTELSKTLFDYTGKIRQNTTDMINGLWRDFTTVFALLILNFSFKKPDLPFQLWTFLFVGLIAYLGISFGLTSRMGFWFYKSVKTSLKTMRKSVYGYMDDKDYEIYALSPLLKAQSRFRSTFFIVMIFYLAIVVCLLYIMGSFAIISSAWENFNKV